MTLLKLQHQWQGTSLLPQDRFVNSVYVHADATVVPADYATLAGYFNAFFTGTLYAIYCTTAMTANAVHSTKVYDMADPKPRVPKVEVTHAKPAGAANLALPFEMSMCVSYQATPVSGVNQARRRGRMYLGPLTSVGLTQDANGEMHPGAGLLTAAGAAMNTFADAVKVAGAGYSWVVYSPTNGALASSRVQAWWCDNAFDVQRRRGLKSTARSSGTIRPTDSALAQTFTS